MLAHRSAVHRLVVAVFLFLAGSTPALAQDRLCDPAERDEFGSNCRDILVKHIRQENVALDVAFWFMEDSWMASEIIARHKAGVHVRILMDTEANVSTPRNITRLAEFEAAGIPMRERISSGIMHWKMMLFEGQGIVEFSGANYSSDAWTVMSANEYENYTDESIYFTSKPSLVNSFRSKFDDLWVNTTQYANYRNVTEPLTRFHGLPKPIDPELNFVPDESHAVRAVAAYEQETRKIDVIMYRITDSRYSDAMIAAKARGILIRLITEPLQYRDKVRQYHSWNIDRMYMAGIQIRNRQHAGLNHQKSVLLYDRATTIFGSSNWSSASSESQEEHNLFTKDPWVFQWFVNQFERKWNNTARTIDSSTKQLISVAETSPFTPLPPDQPTGPSPNQETGVAANGVTLRWNGGYWAHKYDVYIGTSSSTMTRVGENIARVSSGDDLNSFTLSPLASGTTYYWRVVARTMANVESASPTWSFTTSGTAPAPPPPAPKLITLVREPYLQQVTSTSAVVVWATRESGDGALLVTSPNGSRVSVAAPSKLYAASATGMGADYYQYEAKITGLTPGTTYTYDIIVSNEDLNAVTDTIRTAPASSTSTVTFVTFGDSGTGSPGQQQVASRLQQENFDLALHAGDIAYANSSGTGPASHQTMQDWFFTPYSSWLRNKPVFPSMGNHDSRATNGDGRPYLDLYVLPTDGATAQYPEHAERYYSFDYGPVHVIVLDTEFAFQDPARRAAQIAWADADLAATTRPWKVALYHRSAYSAGREHGSELPVREAFAPVFDRHGVHLALSAHEHNYERTKPLRAGVADPAGTTYVVSGGGGGPLYPAGVAGWTAKSASVHHYVRGIATECTMNLSAIGVDGVVFDTVEIRRCGMPTDPPVEPPPPPPAGAPGVTLDTTNLSFGATMRTGSFEAATEPRAVRLRQTGAGQVSWRASASEPWITVSPSSGDGGGDLTIGVRYAPGLPTSGEVRGVVVVDVTGAANALPPIEVVLRLTQTGLSSEPYGSFDTPADGALKVTGSIAVTGWALDDVQVTAVRIYRNCLAMDAGGCQTVLGERLAYIADARFVEGERRDVQLAYPTVPNASRAGWGYLLLTNMLPHLPQNRHTGGQGDFTLYAIAADADAHLTLLGRRTIQVDNDNADTPFGAIDSPGQGETVSGVINIFGWALTPANAMIRTNEPNITLHVDGRPVGQLVYNLCRGTVGSPAPAGRCNDDVATLFPNYLNITQGGGAIAWTTLDTTTLTNGPHRIELSVTDDHGRSAGIGSRFIYVVNPGR